MNALTKKALAKAFGKGAESVPVAAIDDIAALEALAAEASGNTPRGRLDKIAALDLPVCVGGLELRRLSIGALEWLNGLQGGYYAGDARTMDIAVVYALAHSHEPDALAAMGGSVSTTFKLHLWARTLKASWASLNEAAEYLLGIDRNRPAAPAADTGNGSAEDNPADFGPVLECLLSEYGNTAEYWLWEVPCATVTELLAARERRLSIQSGERGGMTSAQVSAHKAFKVAAVAFVAKWGRSDA